VPQSLSAALAAGPVVLDGGLSTELERAGADVSSALWSARLLADDPGAVLAAHLAFFRAGARVATTASYQASDAGYRTAGLGPAAPLLRRSIELAARARTEAGLDGSTWVAASVGPYGAVLADGSEYTGGYADELGVHGLRAFHRPRLKVLADAGADVLACETVPAAAEAEALLAELDRLGVPAWLSLTTTVDADGTVRTRRGEPAAEVFAMAADVPCVVAVGVNCTAPEGVLAAVEVAATSGLPVVAYPNSGERWDAQARRWTGSPQLAETDVTAWLDAGARLVGGCCRVGPEQVQALAALV
jgi:homocysteine S-methyltransferase